MRSRDSNRVGRRQMLKLTAGAALVLPEFQFRSPQSPPPRGRRPGRKRHRFFTEAEFLMVDELSELIIPDDGHSPGARAAKVADYLDRMLGESLDTGWQQQWREGLKRLGALALEMNGQPFMDGPVDGRTAILERISRNEARPETAEEKFFVELKSQVARGYYTSEIGLKQELEYQGNTYLREFVGE